MEDFFRALYRNRNESTCKPTDATFELNNQGSEKYFRGEDGIVSVDLKSREDKLIIKTMTSGSSYTKKPAEPIVQAIYKNHQYQTRK